MSFRIFNNSDIFNSYSVTVKTERQSDDMPGVNEDYRVTSSGTGTAARVLEFSAIFQRVNELIDIGYNYVSLIRDIGTLDVLGPLSATGIRQELPNSKFSIINCKFPVGSGYSNAVLTSLNTITTPDTWIYNTENATQQVYTLYGGSNNFLFTRSVSSNTSERDNTYQYRVIVDEDTSYGYPLLPSNALPAPLALFFSVAPVNSYEVTITRVANGIATVPVSHYNSGITVTVTFVPDSGYSVDWDNVTITTTGAATVLIKDTDTTGHFTMPTGDVTINPAFVRALRAGVQVSGGNGAATVSNEHPAEGDTVTITCYPDSGYEVDTVTSFDATISQVATNQYQFTMPNVDVLATVTFKETPFFNITVEATSNGTVSVNPSSGYSGTTIQLTVAPDTGYSLKHLYVLAGTDSVPTTKVDDTHYTFTLPSFNVVVRALFTDGDPYSPGGNSDPSTPGGTGSFDDKTTPITPPAIPSVSVQDTGLYTIFSLSQSELNSFTNYLWSSLFSLDTVTKYLNNATEHILSLHVLPFSVSAGSSREIKFMGIGTGSVGNVVSNQHQQIDCGSVLLEEYYGSALDYNPWTKLKLYVPYCGEIELDPDEVMGKAVSLKYTVDILTGDCYANVAVSGTTMYQLSGNCAMRLPVSASNWSSVLRAAASGLAIAAGVGAAAMGAVGAGLTAAGAEAFRVSNEAMGTRAGDIAFGEAVALGRAGQAVTERTPQVGSTNSYMATMAQKSSFIHTGVQTGGASFMSVQVPYILIKRPRQALPENFNHYVGYPAHYTRTLGNMTGFTQIVDWNPSSIPCTESERTEIDRLLKEGVIL